MKTIDWAILAIVIILSAVIVDSAMAVTRDDAHPICQTYGEYAYYAAEARDEGMAKEEVLATTQGNDALAQIVEAVFNSPEAAPIDAGRHIYGQCMAQLVDDHETQ